MEEEFSLDDLVQMSGVNLRTIRFYIQEGLLPGPDSRGKFAHYSRRHLDALTLIQRFKRFNMPLQQIKQVLANSTMDEISQMVMYQNVLNPSYTQPVAKSVEEKTDRAGSALDYLRHLENVWSSAEASAAPAPLSAPAPAQPSKSLMSRIAMPKRAEPTPAAETWQRRVLADGVELMIRSDHQIDETILRKIVELLKTNQM